MVRTYQGATETVTLYEPECTYDPSNNEAILTVLNTYSQDDYNQVLAACLAAEDACTAAGITDLAAPTEEQKASQVYQDYLKAKAALDEADEKMAAAYTGGAVLVQVPYGTDEVRYVVNITAQDGTVGTAHILLRRRNASVSIDTFQVGEDASSMETLTARGDNDEVYTALIDSTSIFVDITTEDDSHKGTQARVYTFPNDTSVPPVASGNQYTHGYVLPTSVGINESIDLAVNVRDVNFFRDDAYVSTPYAEKDYTLSLYRTSNDLEMGKIIAVFNDGGKNDLIREATPTADNPYVYEVSIPSTAERVRIQATAENAYTHLYYMSSLGTRAVDDL